MFPAKSNDPLEVKRIPQRVRHHYCLGLAGDEGRLQRLEVAIREAVSFRLCERDEGGKAHK